MVAQTPAQEIHNWNISLWQAHTDIHTVMIFKKDRLMEGWLLNGSLAEDKDAGSREA